MAPHKLGATGSNSLVADRTRMVELRLLAQNAAGERTVCVHGFVHETPRDRLR
jgi:hypothetical protein